MKPTQSYDLTSYARYVRKRNVRLLALAIGAALCVFAFFAHDRALSSVAMLVAIGFVVGTIVSLGERLWAMPSWLRVQRRFKSVVVPAFSAGNYSAARAELEALLNTAAGREYIFVRLMLLTSIGNACASMGDADATKVIAQNIEQSGVLFAPNLRRRTKSFAAYVGGLAVMHVLVGDVNAAQRLLAPLTPSERDSSPNVVLVCALVAFCAQEPTAVEQVERASRVIDSVPNGGVFKTMLLMILEKQARSANEHERAAQYASTIASVPQQTRDTAERTLSLA